MATYYIAVAGNDTTGVGSSGAPWKTLGKAMGVATAGDTIKFKSGATAFPGGYTPKSGIIYTSDNPADPAVIDCALNSASYCFGGGDVTDVTISDLVLKNATTANLTFNRAKNVKILRNFITGSLANGISFQQQPDCIEIDGNVVFQCATTAQANSGISILQPQTDSSLTALEGGWGIKVTNNVVVGNGKMKAKDADGNGIILDKFHWLLPETSRYTRPTLVSGNLVFGNAACGIKAVFSQDITIEHNTCAMNKRRYAPGNLDPVSGDWMGEIQLQHCANCIVRDNIGYSTIAAGSCLTNCAYGSNVTNPAVSTHLPLPVNGHTYARNIFYATAGRTNWASGGSAEAPTLGSFSGGVISGAFANINPLLLAPTASLDDLTFDSGSALTPQTASKVQNFRLQAGSPGRDSGASGTDVGYWDHDASVVTPITKLTDPVLTIANPVSGQTASFTIGTYSGAVTLAHQVQTYNSATASWVDVAVSLSGTNPKTFTIPVVASTRGIRIGETPSGAGVPTGLRAFSNWIDVSPAPVISNSAPVNTVAPVISPSDPAVGVAATCSTGTWTGTPVPTFTYQWKAAGTNISGATGASYTPVSGDKTKTLTCAVTASNSEGSATATSAATSAVVDPTDMTLTQATAAILALQAQIATLQANDTTQTARLDSTDAGLAQSSADLADRLGALESSTGDLPNRVTAAETKISENGLTTVQNATSISALSAVVSALTGYSASGKLVAARDLAHSLNQSGMGNYREIENILRAIIDGRTKVMIATDNQSQGESEA